MKIQLVFKSPDGVSESLRQFLDEHGSELNEDEIYEKLSKFVKYGEYVTIEVDLEEETARVVPV